LDVVMNDNNNLVQAVGAAIAARRKARGLTQAQVTEIMGIEKETLSRIENGVISPTLTRLKQIADILECSVSDLFKRYPLADSDHADTITELIQELSKDDQALVVHFVAEVVKVLKSKEALTPETNPVIS
jgi:transcriptional regulator with XRE-family HTH domain